MVAWTAVRTARALIVVVDATVVGSESMVLDRTLQRS